MSKKKVLVIGAAGFVGSHLLSYLLSQNNTAVYATILQHESISADFEDKIPIAKVDILAYDKLCELINGIQPDYILHLAAQSSVHVSWKKPQLTFQINTIGTINLLEAVRIFSPASRILIVGSSEQYGQVKPENLPVCEDSTLEPENPYAISKLAQEDLARLYYKSYQTKVILVRAFNHIGPGQSSQFVISDFAKQVAEINLGIKDPQITVGNLNAKRDFTDVRDIVNCYWLLIQNGVPGEIYNVGSGKSISISDVLEMIIKQSAKNIRVIIDKDKYRPLDTPEIVANIDKLHKCIPSWNSEYEIEKSIEDTVRYWTQNLKRDHK